jgi:hypothetical protein
MLNIFVKIFILADLNLLIGPIFFEKYIFGMVGYGLFFELGIE